MKTACVGIGNLLVWIFLVTNVFAQPSPPGGRGGGTNNYDPPLYSVPDYRNLEGGNWLLADQDFDYAALEQQNAAIHTLAKAMGLESDADTSASTYTFPTNGLWLEITGMSNSAAWFNLHNATDMVYEVWSKTDLSDPSWNIEQEVWPGTNQDVMPFTVPELDRTNLFIWARDWTGVTENGNTTPDWWFWEYFGTVALSDTNLDSTGTHTLLYDYQNGTDPNIVQFSLQFTNYYVNTLNAPVQLNIVGGVPSYMAVLVNDMNQADAVWQPYTSSNIVATLGSADGTYTVFVGLRGLPPEATQTWRWASVTLYSDAPMLTITNPTTSMVSQSPIQLQGYASNPLDSLSFDVSNAAGVFTNQIGFLTGQFYDTNLLAYTTNYFECSGIALNNGTNVITLHATDWAGNTANVSFTLDYSPNTNPPVLNLVWPQDGTTINGSHFTLQAQVSDPTATVTASINGNAVQGLVERSGLVWVNNLPLAAGTNTVTVTAMDAAGNTSTTNLTLFPSSVTVTLDPLASDQLNQSSVSVSGTVSDPTCSVWVNGIQATVNSDETWSADNVPVSPTGTAVFDVEVYGGSNPNVVARAQTGLRLQANDLPSGTATGSEQFVRAQPVTVVLAGYSGFINKNGFFFAAGLWPVLDVKTVNWAYDAGGNETDTGYVPNDAGTAENYFNWPDSLPADGPGFATPELGLVWDYFSVNIPDGDDGDFQRSSKAQVMIAPSGQEQAGTTNIYLVLACASEYSNPVQDFGAGSGDLPLPPEWLQINGQTLINTGITNGDGSVWGETILSAPAGATTNVTPVATQLYGYNSYTFTNQAFEVNLQLGVDANRDGQINFDNSDATTPAKPFRFWINDSKESGDVVSGAEDQIPGQAYYPANYSLIHVNGRSDLVNFFPVALCLSNTLQLLPLSSGYEYHLYQADSASIGGAVKFVYTSLTHTNAFDYLTNTASFGYGANFDEAAMNADTIPVDHDVVLDTNFLAYIQNNGGMGVILVEGCAATPHPLMLEIWRNGKLLAGTPLYLSISGVEQMYRHKNLRDGDDAPSGLAGNLTVRDNDASLPTQMSEPANYPDSLFNQWFFNERWFIFVVGSNVGGKNARGWESEVFKRMYWSGNKAKFVGVSWFGDPYTNNEGVFDYHMAVRNAFATAPSLASFVNGLNGSKTIAGHSLGCGLIASATADYGISVNNACLMDAGFAQECFDGDVDDNFIAMVPDLWQSYTRELWAAYWHERFPTTDARSTLTWRGRFAGAVGNVYNFYSSTEDVLGEYDGEVPGNALEALIISGTDVESYVWTYQEKSKGNRHNYYVPFYPGHFHAGSTYGGWGFNMCDGYFTSYPIWYEVLNCNCSRRVKTPVEIGTVTQDLLDGSRYNPLFDNGWGAFNANNAAAIYVNIDTTYFTGPSWILGLYDPVGGNTIASDPAKRAQLLAEAIPALSLPVGANPCSQIPPAKQYNMPAEFADATHWPRGKDQTTDISNWHHSDMDQIAYPYLYKFYYKLVSISNQ